MGADVIAAGVGNVFLSDDGFGVEVARRLAAEDLPTGTRVLDVGIRGFHLAYEVLDGCRALVLIDAMLRGDAPGTLTVLDVADGIPAHDGPVDGHSLDPAATLALVERLGGRLPRTYVVACEPAVLDPGVGLSPAVAAAVESAVDVVRQLLEEV